MRYLGILSVVILLAQVSVTLAEPRDEKSLFYMPEDEHFRFQDIDRRPNEEKWPFADDGGTISCAWILGERMVTYFPKSNVDCQCDDPENPEGSDASTASTFPHLSISTDPIDLIVLNLGNRDLFAKTSSIEELITRVAPYYAIGLKLCEQPQGTYLRRSEL